MNKTDIFEQLHIPDQSKLRDYQKECIDKITSAKPGAYLIVLPTGAGKTFVFSHIPRKGRVLILSHRDELVHQPLKYYRDEKVFDENGNELECATCGVEQAAEHSNGEEIVSASVQSLIRRLNKFDPYDFDMIITDEAHHSVAPSYQKIYEYFKPRYHFGFTATPDRNDKNDLHKVYSSILYMKDLKWGIDQNYLTDIRAYQADVGYDLRDVLTRLGDFQIESLGEKMLTDVCLSNVVKTYIKMAKDKSTIMFCVNVMHAEVLCNLINTECGEGTAACITGKTENRDEIYEAFNEGRVKCICNCMVVTEGVDIPKCDCIIICRPTMNMSLYCQMVGRGLRPYPGKEWLTLIDCVGVTKRPIATVGSLFGLNIELVPKEKREQLNGELITKMEIAIDKIIDTPKFWISDECINIFENENEVDLLDIAFTPMANGSLKLSFSKESTLYVPETDALGETQAYICDKYDESIIIKAFERSTLQEAINQIHAYLVMNHANSRLLWDARVIESTWGWNAASEKQKDLLKKLLKRYSKPCDVEVGELTKAQASTIIERLMSEIPKPAKKTATVKKQLKGAYIRDIDWYI